MHRLFKLFRYLIEMLLAVILYGFFRLLPYRLASNIGGTLSRVIGPKLRAHQTALNNLLHIFPEHSPKELQIIAIKMWDNIGRVIGELPHLSSLNNAQFHAIQHVEGSEILDDLKASHQQVIFVSAHIGNWEVLPHLAARYGFTTGLIYRKANNPFVEKLIRYCRREPLLNQFQKGQEDAKAIVNFIKDGGNIALLTDQKMNEGISVPLFGFDAMTAPAVATLALKYNIPIVPAKAIRDKTDPSQLKTTIYPPLYFTNTGDRKRDLTNAMVTIHKIFEDWMQERPDQWFWVHNRWSF